MDIIKKTISKEMNRYINSLFKIYKAVLSPVFHLGILPLPFASGCRFYPSCSEYARESFGNYSPIRAFIKSLFRVLRCNPFSKPRIDLP